MPVKFIRFIELVNGRAAMFGCSAIGLGAIATKADLLQNIHSENFLFVWRILGVYAG